MLAYHNDQSIKDKYVNRAIAHCEADELAQGYGYWKNGKGCAIGCLAHSSENPHEVLEKDAGLPVVLNRLADVIFEGLADDKYKAWPERYADAPKSGADLSQVADKWFFWLLTVELPQVLDGDRFPDVSESLKKSAELFNRRLAGQEPSLEEWGEAGEFAGAATRAALAAEAAWASWVAEVARAAARVALAAEAAEVAAWAAWAAEVAYERMADKLIELMENAPVVDVTRD